MQEKKISIIQREKFVGIFFFITMYLSVILEK